MGKSVDRDCTEVISYHGAIGGPEAVSHTNKPLPDDLRARGIAVMTIVVRQNCQLGTRTRNADNLLCVERGV